MTRDKAYWAAEEEISSVQLTKTKTLTLNVALSAPDNMKLTEIPDSLKKLSWITELNLSGNNLTELPHWINKLTNLQILRLSNNQLTTLPELLGQLTLLQELDLSNNQLTTLPESLGQVTQLQELDLSNNKLTALPESLGQLKQLHSLNVSANQLTKLPESLGQLAQLGRLYLDDNPLVKLPSWVGQLTALRILFIANINLGTVPDFLGQLIQLKNLKLSSNSLTSLPESLSNLKRLELLDLFDNRIISLPEWLGELDDLEDLYLPKNQLSDLPTSLRNLNRWDGIYLDYNPLNPELAKAYEQGFKAVKAYLRAKAEGEIILNEAKLILVGEGGVGKTSLLAALHGDEWVENRKTTYGMEVDVTSLILKDPVTGVEITFNGWDFGGQDIYRHTHQLFFTAPAVYLAVWEPRRGPQQSRVSEWIKMIKHRAYDESRPDLRPRILVVATHGGPKERLAHIDEQALRDEFGDMIAGFYHVDSRPDENGICYQLDQLKDAIAGEAASIPSVGRSVPLSWKKILAAVRKRSAREPYISYSQYEALCGRQGVSKNLAELYTIILNELGYLIHYRNDETLKDTVILKPDYLSKAVSFILEDKATKEANGLIEHQRLGKIWDDPARPARERYPIKLHPIQGNFNWLTSGA